ncbi:hypothetical protein [Acinetobacter sp. MD2(2019)]|uniref:hypothetical protein n=1 Tax=Acinetobacter sp. MD2(2019) TaxID=2605273 RepID=UPI002D1F1510|nr:hypothetical protein [Acinetobacter sp. MD2(2019)]MEB3753828.1 hypothetical protein [Acinetobacter sp. MD2(2019)]
MGVIPDDLDSLHIILNFEELATGSTDLEFKDDATVVTTGTLESYIDLSVLSESQAIDVNAGQLETSVNLGVLAELTDGKTIVSGTLNAYVDLSCISETQANFDINFILGLSLSLTTEYQKATAHVQPLAIPWQKAVLKAHNSAFSFARSLGLSGGVSVEYERTISLGHTIKTVFEQANRLQQSVFVPWQVDKAIRNSLTLPWDVTNQTYQDAVLSWVELDHRRKQFTYAHEAAKAIEKHYVFEFDKGLELITASALVWDEGRAIYYRKHKVEPWPKPTTPDYIGSTDLDFQCLCIDVDAHNVILDFGNDDCIPQIAPVEGWHIVNDVQVTRADTGEVVHVLSGSVGSDRSKWCWDFSLTVPDSQIDKTRSSDGNPVILVVAINGKNYRMLVEDRSQSIQFGNRVYTVTGRSPTALLDTPASPTRTFLQENERTSVQLVQAELDRVSSTLALNWQLIDELGWIVPAQSLSYSNLAPIAAIKMIAEAGGGFIYSEPESDTLSIKTLYKKTYWDAIEMSEYDRIVPSSLAVDIGINDTRYPEYNSVWLTNDKTGDTYKVLKTGTDGATQYETQNNPLYTAPSAFGNAGKAFLAKAGLVEMHTFQMPITQSVGHCELGEVFAYDGQWWGIVDSVSIAFSYEKVIQTVAVERVVTNE